MKKTIKLALVLTIAILATACNNVKTLSIPGTYKGDKFELRVATEGTASFGFLNGVSYTDITKDKNPNEYYFILSDAMGYSSLVPWDLLGDKTKQEFEVKKELNKETSSEEKVIVTLKFVFTKDGENVKCEVTSSGLNQLKRTSIPGSVPGVVEELKDISLTFTKSLK